MTHKPHLSWESPGVPTLFLQGMGEPNPETGHASVDTGLCLSW